MTKSPLISFPGNTSPILLTISRSLVPISAIPFTPPFDVISELSTSRDSYIAHDRDNTITLYIYPPAVRISIDSLRSRTTKTVAGAGITLVCCASHGLSLLSADHALSTLGNSRKRLDFLIGENPAANANEYEEIISILDRFDVSMLPDDSKRKFAVHLPERLKLGISGLSSELKISQGSLFILCVMMTLVTQTAILDKHRQEMKTCLDKVFCRAVIRCKIARMLLEMIDPEGEIATETSNETEDYDDDND